jgi:oligopeptidase B
MTSRAGIPQPKAVPSARTYHGMTLADEYAWMLETDSGEMRDHLAAERAFTLSQLSGIQALRDTVLAEMRSRHVSGHPTAPTRNGAWWYFTRRPEGAGHLQYWRRRAGSEPGVPTGKALDEGAQLILDGNAVRAELGGFSLGAFRPSPDHMMLAFGVDATGNERFTLMFRDLTSGELLPDRLTSCHYTCVWSADGTRVLYTTADERNRPYRVWRHVLGTPQAADELVLEEPDPSVWLTVGSMRSGDYLFIRGAASTSTEYHLLDAHDPDARPSLVRAREAGTYYEVDHQRTPAGDGLLYILHNRHGANFELATARLEAVTQWRTVIPHRDDRRLHWAMAFRQGVVVYARTRGRTGLIVLDADGTQRLIEFDEPGVVVSPASNPDYVATAFRISYTSPVTPPSVRSVDLATGASTAIDQMPVGPAPSGRPYDPGEYVSCELWAPGTDGTSIPVSLVQRKDLPADRAHPCVLYAYGAYERAADMGFSANRLSLLDRGFIYAVAHVRGGGELGKQWHEGGRLAAKQNSLNDYLACATFLIREGRTARGLIIGRGSSAGGLVIGGALNIDPGMFGGVVLAAPFVDPLTSLLDPGRALTVPEWDELGNPIDDPEAFARIRSYSPYENVTADRYPPVLAIAGAQDARVSIAEPARWIARLRARASGGPFLMLPESDTGHRGPTGRQEVLTRDALVTAWIIDVAAKRQRGETA